MSLSIQPFHNLDDQDFYLHLIPKEFKDIVADPASYKEYGTKSYFFYIIYSGFLPIGYLGHRLVPSHPRNTFDCSPSYSLDITHISILTSQLSRSLCQELMMIIHSLIFFFPSLQFRLIRCSVFDSNPIWPLLSCLLLDNSWSISLRLTYCQCDPFVSLEFWQHIYSLFKKIYLRYYSRSIHFQFFNNLTHVERCTLEGVNCPAWAHPFNPSLLSRPNSKYSVCAFDRGVPLAWLISDALKPQSLTVETSWFVSELCSPALIYAMFFLTFSNMYDYSGKPNHKEFTFGYEQTNLSMTNLHRLLAPMICSHSSLISYTMSISV